VQRQQRIDPGGDHQPQSRRGMLQHVGQPFQHLGAGQQVDIVQDKGGGGILRRHQRGEPEQEFMVDRIPAHRRDHGPGNGHAGPPQCLQDVGPEHPGLVVMVVDGDPRGRALDAGRGPHGQGHRLARPGWPGHRRHRPPRALDDEFLDARPRDEPFGNAGHGDLGRQERVAGPGRLPPRARRRRNHHTGHGPHRLFAPASGRSPAPMPGPVRRAGPACPAG